MTHIAEIWLPESGDDPAEQEWELRLTGGRGRDRILTSQKTTGRWKLMREVREAVGIQPKFLQLVQATPAKVTPIPCRQG